MASCDDDFSLLSDDQTTNHHHHPHHHLYAPHRFTSKPNPIHAPPPQPIPDNLGDGRGDEVETEDDDETNSAFHGGVNPFSADENSNPKRKDREEISDGGGGGTNSYNYNNTNTNNNKKTKSSSNNNNEYRKDREEWSDAAIGCLLDAYLEKFTQLNRGNLRGRDWEEVAAIVSDRCDKQTKSVEQCKNKVDNLKKRYKLERHRMTNGGTSGSHWPWYKKMEEIVGNSLPIKVVVGEEDKGFATASANSVRQSKR